MNNQVTPEAIKNYIADKLNCEYIDVNGDGRHFDAVIVSNEFNNQSRIARHRIVFGTLGDRMKEEIHALSIKTFTPEEWQSK